MSNMGNWIVVNKEARELEELKDDDPRRWDPNAAVSHDDLVEVVHSLQKTVEILDDTIDILVDKVRDLGLRSRPWWKRQ